MLEDTVETKVEYALLSVGVTSACGIVPVSAAEVTVSYNGPPDCEEKQTLFGVTDESGRTDTFFLYARRAKIGNKYVNYPRYSKCDVSICAKGYVPLKVREIPVFPGITVVRYFDLIPLSEK